jgi:hypothetical protein
MELREYPGYIGLHTQDEAPGAMPNGTRIVKVLFEKGDTHAIGSTGIVLGSIPAPNDPHPPVLINHFYFIEWDDYPGFAVGVADLKIARKNT